jgi:hypothetical protein
MARNIKLGSKNGASLICLMISATPACDYLAAQDELKVIDATARDKKCKTPENWRSTFRH